MKKCLNIIICFLVLSFLSLSLVSATTTANENYNFFTDMKHRLGLFTAEGQSRSCDLNAKLTITQTQSGVTYSLAQLTSGAGCSVSLIDVFDSSWHFLSEYRSESIGSGLYKTNPGIIEIYCCPYAACTSNSGCSSAPAKNYGNTCNTNYGSCYNSLPTYSTKVYKCVSGNWVQQTSASYGNDHFCSSQSNNNYISQTGNEGCYASAPSGWCTASPPAPTCKATGQSCILASDCCSGNDCQYFQCTATGTCTAGNTKCGIVGNPNNVGDILYNCVSGTWQSQGKVVGQCGYSTQTCLTSADVNCDNKISRDELGEFIDLWLSGSVSRSDLGVVISNWAI